MRPTRTQNEHFDASVGIALCRDERVLYHSIWGVHFVHERRMTEYLPISMFHQLILFDLNQDLKQRGDNLCTNQIGLLYHESSHSH